MIAAGVNSSNIAYVKVDIIAIYKIFHVGYELKER